MQLLRSTLDGQLQRPINTARDISDVPIRDFVRAIREYAVDDEDFVEGDSEDDALCFYYLDHAVGLVRQRRRPGDTLNPDEIKLFEAYNEHCGVIAIRAVYYLFLICCREARHTPDHKKPYLHTLGAKFGVSEAHTLITKFPDANDAEQVIDKFKYSPPQRTLGQITQLLVAVFWEGGFSGAMGGPKWGAIAEVLNQFVFGLITPTLLLDVVWSLEHNTCGIFNKGMLYVDQSAEDMKAVLDCQHAGLIPNLVASNDMKLDHVIEPATEGLPDLRWLGPEFNPGCPAINWSVVSQQPKKELNPVKPAWLVQAMTGSPANPPVAPEFKPETPPPNGLTLKFGKRHGKTASPKKEDDKISVTTANNPNKALAVNVYGEVEPENVTFEDKPIDPLGGFSKITGIGSTGAKVSISKNTDGKLVTSYPVGQFGDLQKGKKQWGDQS